MAKRANSAILFAILILIIATQRQNTNNQPSITFVTALFDLHGDATADHPRTFQYYLDFFQKVLSLDINLIIYGDEVVKKFVWQRRKSANTYFIYMNVEQIHKKWYSDKVDEVRLERTTWPFFQKNKHILFSLKDYNTLVLSKFQFLSQAVMEDPFHSQYFYWFDGGFFHVEKYEQIFPQNSVVKFMDLLQPVWLFHAYQSWPNRFFGYKSQFQKEYLDRKLDRLDEQLRGNFVGGLKAVILDNKFAFTNLLNMHLHNNDLNSQEGVWTLMQIRYPYLCPNNFAGHFNFHNHTITNKQNIFKNQDTQRHFYLRISNNFMGIDSNIINRYQYDLNNESKLVSTIKSKIVNNYEGRIEKLRNLVLIYKSMLQKRRSFLIILAIFGISLLIFIRKVQQKQKSCIQNEYNSIPCPSSYYQKTRLFYDQFFN